MPVSIDKITWNPILFFQYMHPNGGLTQERETHALFYYYLLAKKALEKEKDGIVYEGDRDPEIHYRQLFTSIARAYGVRPENMANCWKEVDYTCFVHNLPKLPDEARYRQDGRPVIII